MFSDPRQGLQPYFKDVMENEIIAKFAEKNNAYAKKTDEFKAFRDTAARWLPEEFKDNPYQAMFHIMGILQDKHLAALPKGFNVLEFRERLIDIIVYALFGLAFYDASVFEDQEKQTQACKEADNLPNEEDYAARANAGLAQMISMLTAPSDDEAAQLNVYGNGGREEYHNAHTNDGATYKQVR